MGWLPLTLSSLAVLAVVLFGGFKAGWEHAHRKLGDRVGYLAVRVATLDATVKRLNLEVQRLDSVTVQWTEKDADLPAWGEVDNQGERARWEE